MDAFLTPRLTEKGVSMVIRAIYGDSITFTKIVMGNGVPADLDNVTEVANPLLDIPFIEAEQEDNYILLTGETSSAQIESSFYGNELGVYAKDESDNEFLYAYRYTEQADFFPSSSEGRTVELRISVAVAVGNAENVTAILIEGEEYATKADFNAHVDNMSNPHNVTASQIGLGNVVNVAPNNMTPTFTQASSRTNIVSGETLSVLFGKIAKVISDFIAHLTATNPHNITASGIGASATGHKHSATDITSGTLGVARGGTGQTSLQATRNAMGLGNTTGALPVANGGTGQTSVDTTPTANSQKMCTSGGIKTALDTKAASSHTHGAGDITSGTLAVARGGTGQATLDLAVGTAGARNIYAGTSGMTHNSTALTTGRIYLQYI